MDKYNIRSLYADNIKSILIAWLSANLKVYVIYDQ